jgi:hypothetical protein
MGVMTTTYRLIASLTLAFLVMGITAGAETESSKTWLGRHQEIEKLLETAEIVDVVDVGTGVTNPKKVTLKDGDSTFYAAFKPITRGRQKGYWESYQAEVAAYRIDKLLGLDMVPPTVTRRIDRTQGSLQFWVDDCRLYSEVEGEAPRSLAWSRQLSTMKMFDVLIANEDRNAQNFLVDPDFFVVLIDHSRAFITSKSILKNKSKLPIQFDRDLVAKLKALDRETLDTHLEDLLMGGQVKAVLERRDGLLKYLDELIRKRGEGQVLF